MRNDAHIVTLTQVIHRHWLSLIHETAMTETTFAANVREHYEQAFQEHARSVDFSSHKDLVTRMKRDAEKISRWFSDDVAARLPAEMIESVIAAFPPDRRFKLQIELSDRQCLIAVPRPKFIPGEDGACLGRIGKETGEAIIKISELLDDNVIDERDADKAPETIREIDEAVAVMLSMRSLIIEKTKGVKRNAAMGN